LKYFSPTTATEAFARQYAFRFSAAGTLPVVQPWQPSQAASPHAKDSLLSNDGHQLKMAE